MNKALLPSLLLLSLLFVGTSLALQISPTSITIPSNKLSYYNITFYNNQNVTLNISIDTALAKISYTNIFYNIGAKPDVFSLAPGQSQQVLFSFGTYSVYFSFPVPINFTYLENGVQKSFVINAPITPPSISNSIYLYSLSANNSLYPYQPIYMKVNIINSIGQSGVVVPLNYSLVYNGNRVYSAMTNVVLSNLGLNKFNFSFNLDNMTPPGTYTLLALTSYNNNVSRLAQNVTVLPYHFAVSSSGSNFDLWGGSASLTIKNDGNYPLPLNATALSVGSFNSIFISSEYASLGTAALSSAGLVPSLAALAPGQQITISYTVSYYPIYLIVIIIVLAIALALYFNRKIVVSKEVVERRASGGFIDVKLAIRVKNISKKPLTDVIIRDSAPQTALKVSMMGPKEGKIEHSAHGMRFVWRELELSPGDELILMYEIKSKIGIVGSINLLPADCEFRYGNKNHSKKSNSLILNIR